MERVQSIGNNASRLVDGSAVVGCSRARTTRQHPDTDSSLTPQFFLPSRERWVVVYNSAALIAGADFTPSSCLKNLGLTFLQGCVGVGKGILSRTLDVGIMPPKNGLGI